MRALAQGLGGSLENVTVTGPLGAPVVCEYAIWEKRNIGGSGRIDFVGKRDDGCFRECFRSRKYFYNRK